MIFLLLRVWELFAFLILRQNYSWGGLISERQLDLHLSELLLEVAHSFFLGLGLFAKGIDDLIEPLNVLLMLNLFLRNSPDLVDSCANQCGASSWPSKLCTCTIVSACSRASKSQASAWWCDIAILGYLALISEYCYLVALEQLSMLPR